ncbi:hypothetical protein ABZ477_17475 [Microbacterium sp. NPDC019599]|uniref:hypothetical protein n=1 Tax=Microbacterium sp. NPDC019599 TaxID=3154690 RepID=UPI0033DDE9DE
MEEIFYGPWDVRVVSRDAWFSQQLVITGSDASDGAYDASPGGGPGLVTGPRWVLHAEWDDNAGSGWQPSALRRSAAYTLADGLVVTIGIDDNLEAVRDHDYDDVVIVARSLDPAHTPLHPLAPPLDFTVPEDVWWKYWKSSGRNPDDPYRGYPPPESGKDGKDDEGKDPRDPDNPEDPKDPKHPLDPRWPDRRPPKPNPRDRDWTDKGGDWRRPTCW